MALSNAERQKRWRDKRNALAKQAEAGLAKGKPASLRNDELAAKLEPLVEGLFAEGAKDTTTMSAGTVARLITLLERTLVEHGVLPESKRSRKPQGYVRTLKDRQTRERQATKAPLRNEGQDKPLLQWTLAPRHSTKARRKVSRTSGLDAGASANAGSGAYNITVTTAGYSVSYSSDIGRPIKNRRTLDGRFPTLEEAKAAAERDRSKLKVT